MLNNMLEHAGIKQLNKMQETTLKTYGGGGNLVLLSPTGSGKTLAYLLPLVMDLMEHRTEGDAASEEAAVQAIVLVPSRELALQTEQVFKSLGSPLRAVSCYGGRPAMEEHRSLRGIKPEVVIATPGRMNDHLGKGNLQAGTVRVLVIDEFDKCLELGFQDEMCDVIRKLPQLRRRVLLSATDAEEIPNFTRVGKDPVRLDFLEKKPSARIQVKVVHSPEKDKLDTLYNLLAQRDGESSLVFVNYRESVDRVGQYLKKRGVFCEMFHGGMEQKDRERALYKFSNGSSNVFVSTDLAARGLDIPDVDNIIHYHLPTSPEAYTHRNGRTARWEAEGNSFLILGPEEQMPEYIGNIQSYRLELVAEGHRMNLPEWVTLYIGKGKKDKLSKGDILGFLCQKGGLDKTEIGRIDVKDHYAFAAISRNKLRDTLRQVQGQKIKGMKTLIEPTK
ncbi:MAG: DEAD/DEAH box helicase [Bacteroidaceae bacterium]|nr:DEAD/DEAH box helicase [Bacteroidaceae bacterium]